ncbi:hypothetical protein FWG76_01390, partial [Candidatus Saccharibacteria bacterium]|nr:hypothetical protein [Candidatus Saccharibacteria bacterium]
MLLSTFFSLIPNGEASAASKLPTSLDGVNRVECINNVQVTGSMSVYYVQYFNLFDSNGNRTNGNGPLGTPSEYYINDNKTSCGEVMSTLFLNVGGVSGDFETVCNSAGGNCEAVRNSANIAVNVVTIDNLRYEGDLDFTFTATIRTNSPDQLPSVSDITTSATVRIDNFWAGTKTISGITHSCSQASGANQYSCTGSFDVRSSLSAQEIQNLRDNGGTVSLTVRAGSASDNATNSFNPDETNPGGPGTVVPGNPDGTDDAVREVTCDLGPFGWALCPLISTIDSMLGGVYEWVENNFLQIDVAFYQVNGGTYRAWEIFRNIANILFVIFFLVVIFSQLTSVGISNYGIKKMLPEIITAAILINLSFFIAQAMVDLSNIVGFQVKSLLEFIAASIQTGTP